MKPTKEDIKKLGITVREHYDETGVTMQDVHRILEWHNAQLAAQPKPLPFGYWDDNDCTFSLPGFYTNEAKLISENRLRPLYDVQVSSPVVDVEQSPCPAHLTDEMVCLGAEVLYDSLRDAGISFDDDMDELHQKVAGHVYRAMHAIAPPAGAGDRGREVAAVELAACGATDSTTAEVEAFAWQLRSDADPCGLLKYMSQRIYELQPDKIKKWYQPYRCANCTNP